MNDEERRQLTIGVLIGVPFPDKHQVLWHTCA
jgi:hypothetical protein